MNHPTRNPRVRILTLAVLAAALGLLVLQTPARLQASTSLNLQPPALPQRAGAAQEAAVAFRPLPKKPALPPTSTPAPPINLDSVADQYATIEARTDSYIIGSVAVPQYNERHQVHVYVHKDGWIMAYYLKTDPVAKMVDIKAYGGTTISTKFDTILSLFASEAGVSLRPADLLGLPSAQCESHDDRGRKLYGRRHLHGQAARYLHLLRSELGQRRHDTWRAAGRQSM